MHSFGLPSDVDIAGIDYTSLTGLDFYNLIRVICSRLLSNCAVPAFYHFWLLFLLWHNSLGNNHKSYFIGKWRKRLYSLLIPYLVWNTIYILYTFFYKNSRRNHQRKIFVINLWLDIWVRKFFFLCIGTVHRGQLPFPIYLAVTKDSHLLSSFLCGLFVTW